MSTEENQNDHEYFEPDHQEMIDHVQATYPGLRRWLYMQRDMESGVTMIVSFDLDTDPAKPVYFGFISSRDLLNGGRGMCLPTLSHAERKHMIETGGRPAGYIEFDPNNPSSAQSDKEKSQ